MILANMGIFNRKGREDTSLSLSPSPPASDDKHVHTIGSNDVGHQDAENTRLHRGLKARQVTMIAIGGAIGTGLIIGTGSALANAGPGSILISYTIVGFIVWIVMCCLGEMATWLPLESGFTG